MYSFTMSASDELQKIYGTECVLRTDTNSIHSLDDFRDLFERDLPDMWLREPRQWIPGGPLLNGTSRQLALGTQDPGVSLSTRLRKISGA